MKLKQLHKNIGISIENVGLANIDDITFEINKKFMDEKFNYCWLIFLMKIILI